MARKVYIWFGVAFVLLVAGHVAYGRFVEYMNPPVTMPDNVQVVDGDRLVLDGTAIHLYGIDAPELEQPCYQGEFATACGQEAKAQLEQFFINSGKVKCEKRDEPVDGWTPAICRVDGRDINGEMVRLGFALAYRDEAFYYTDHEEEARSSGRGIWQRQFETPWEWRAKR